MIRRGQNLNRSNESIQLLVSRNIEVTRSPVNTLSRIVGTFRQLARLVTEVTARPALSAPLARSASTRRKQLIEPPVQDVAAREKAALHDRIDQLAGRRVEIRQQSLGQGGLIEIDSRLCRCGHD